jgi:hypothetical protein
MFRVWDWQAGELKEALPRHRDLLLDARFTPDGRRLVTLGTSDLQVTDWRTRTAVSPLWDLGGLNLSLAVPSGGGRAIVGGGSRSLIGYDLQAMSTPTAAPEARLVDLAELAAGRRILGSGRVVALTGSEWEERWERLALHPVDGD